jgi:hypothetical protein
MKFTFRIEKDTDIDRPVLIQKIASQLKGLRYEVMEKRDTCVTFKNLDKRGSSALRINSFTKANGGIFEIVEIEERRYLKLAYNMSINEEMILFTFLVLIGPFYDFYPWFAAVVFFILFLFRLSSSKEQWKKTIDEIVNRAMQ